MDERMVNDSYSHQLVQPMSLINQQTSVSKDMKKRERLCTVGGSDNWGNHCGKQYGGSSKN